MKTETVKLSKIRLNPDNPRFVRDDKFEKLKKSITDFPEMMELREIIVDENYMILGGNMRYRALKELGHKETIVKVAIGLTDEQKKEFIVKDNVAFGEWDFDVLANEWDTDDLTEWGLELPVWGDENEYSDKNKEIDTDEFSDKMKMEFELSIDEYRFVNEKLSKLNASKEIALLELLNYES